MGVEVGRGVGVARGSLVGRGMLDAETGPATGVCVGGMGVGVSVGALVGVGVGTGSCPQATTSANIRAIHTMVNVSFMRDSLSEVFLVCNYSRRWGVENLPFRIMSDSVDTFPNCLIMPNCISMQLLLY